MGLKHCGKGATIVAFLALYGFLIFHIGAASYSNYPKQQHQYQTQTGTECCTPKKPPLGTWWEWTTHAPVAFWTSVLSMLTGLLFVSAILLWWTTRRGIQTQIADTRILQRAYLSAEPLGVVPFGPVRTLAHVGFKNVGNLPARDVKWRIEVTAVVNRDFRPGIVEINETQPGIMIIPGATTKQGMWGKTNGIPQSFVDAITAPDPVGRTEKRHEFVYVWGAVHYTDGFEKPRTTKFCHRYFHRGCHMVLAGPYKGELALGVFEQDGVSIHEYGNEAD